MNVLVVNAGSSTLKYQVIDTKSHKVSAKGSCERVCFTGGTFTHAANGSKKVTENIEFPDHKVAIEVVLKDLEANGVKIEGIGHRIVQGGWYFGDSSLVDEDVLAKIREVAPLAPLHNNPEANVIEYCLEQYPDLPNVTVYDTAFHFNMPEVAKTYALPKDVCDKLHIRKYGAHGTSYRYISKKVAEMTNGEARKVVVCHIGSGASLCAIEDGKCMDTTMGLTPLDGVMMGTRCGSIDPATVCYLQREGGYTFDEVDEMMNKKSGLLAVTGGKTNDCRNVEELAAAGDPEAQLAFDVRLQDRRQGCRDGHFHVRHGHPGLYRRHRRARSGCPRRRGRSSGLYGRQDGPCPQRSAWRRRLVPVRQGFQGQDLRHPHG